MAFLIWQGASVADAAEIAQDTMALAHADWATISHPEAWTRRVASRALARRMTTLEHLVDRVPEPAVGARTALLPDAAADMLERHEILAALALLPPRQRQVLAWTYDGYSPTEIAEELAITPQAVRASLQKARRALAQHYSQWSQWEGGQR